MRGFRNSMKILNNLGHNFKTIGVVGLPLLFLPACSTVAQNLEKTPDKDKFVMSDSLVKPSGTSKKAVMLGAPSPSVEINGIEHIAKIVVDLSKNILYKYNDFGDAERAYLVASGKPSSPTDTGVRVVTHVETYPYRTAPYSTKRRRNPKAYGPKIICLDKVDPLTGERSRTGEFIHGNNNPASIGKYASLGCIRMDNEVIKALAKEVKRGDIVLIKR